MSHQLCCEECSYTRSLRNSCTVKCTPIRSHYVIAVFANGSISSLYIRSVLTSLCGWPGIERVFFISKSTHFFECFWFKLASLVTVQLWRKPKPAHKLSHESFTDCCGSHTGIGIASANLVSLSATTNKYILPCTVGYSRARIFIVTVCCKERWYLVGVGILPWHTPTIWLCICLQPLPKKYSRTLVRLTVKYPNVAPSFRIR